MNEQTLTLYYYNDGLSDAQRNEVRDALASDARLASRYFALCAELDALGEFSQTSAPAAAIDRLHAAIDAAAQPSALRTTHRQPALWLLPVAAALVLGIGIGLRVADAPPPQDPIALNPAAPAAEPASMQAPPAALTRGLTAYMQQSRVELASLDQASEEHRLTLIGELVDQNRLFERRAVASGAPELARVLRAFEQLLTQLAQRNGDAGQLAEQLEQLSFEYAVMLTKLARPASDNTHSL